MDINMAILLKHGYGQNVMGNPHLKVASQMPDAFAVFFHLTQLRCYLVESKWGNRFVLIIHSIVAMKN
jgi:hypothetical protein